jgi:3'(2'), 5'-bisphosphate nucleotidase
LNTNTNIINSLPIAIKAGNQILEIYKTDFKQEYKANNSPVTIADQAAHKIIVNGLHNTNTPILSEEGEHTNYNIRKDWKKFWLVDPLDGTKEFINRNGEFTVNIALIENGVPTAGIVYAPILDILFFGSVKLGAFKLNSANQNLKNWKDLAVKLPLKKTSSKYTLIASRSHLNKETTDFIHNLKSKYNDLDIVNKGSSLKLCMIAEGTADVYPRYAPTMEWDTAAGHAIINASGGKIFQTNISEEIEYNKQNLLNPWFIAYSYKEFKKTNND